MLWTLNLIFFFAFSSYKSSCTYKALTVVSPHGNLMYVSSAFQGSISDKAIVEKSGFLDFVEDGDGYCVDR